MSRRIKCKSTHLVSKSQDDTVLVGVGIARIHRYIGQVGLSVHKAASESQLVVNLVFDVHLKLKSSASALSVGCVPHCEGREKCFRL